MTAQLLPNVIQYFYNANGAPLAGGKLYSYIAGTTTPLVTYTDETAVTPNTNPIVLNSAGQASVWLGAGAYKFTLTDSLGNLQWTVDNVSYINPGSIDLTKIASSVAGPGLFQNGSGALQVSVDNVTTDLNGSNQIAIKAITPDLLPSTSKMEVLIKNVRDLTCPGLIQTIPQYEWSSPSQISTPVPAFACRVLKWSPNGEFLAIGSGSSPFILIYQMLNGVLTQLPNPGTIPAGAVNDISWSPCGDFLACANSVFSGARITIYQRSGNFFSKLADPLTLPPSDCAKIAFSPNSDFLSVFYLGGGGVGVKLYQRGTGNSVTSTGTGSGTISGTADLSTGVVTGTCSTTDTIVSTFSGIGTTFTDITSTSGLSNLENCIGWTPDSWLFASIDQTSGNIDVYARSGSTFSGITSPDTSSLTGVFAFSFSPDGKFLAVISQNAPYLALFTITSGVFTQITNPTTLPPGVPSNVTWSANSEYLAIGNATSPYIIIYQVSGTTFTKISDLSTIPAAAVTSADWTQNKKYLAVATNTTTPFFQVYQTSSTLPSDALLWVREVPNV